MFALIVEKRLIKELIMKTSERLNARNVGL